MFQLVNDRMRRRWWCRLIFVCLALPVLALAVGNLWLGSEYGRSYIEKKLERKTQLSYQIGAASWTPWSGLYLEDIAVYAEPNGVKLTEVLQIHVLADLWSLSKGHLALQQVTVDSPKVELSITDLKNLLGNTLQDSPTQKGELENQVEIARPQAGKSPSPVTQKKSRSVVRKKESTPEPQTKAPRPPQPPQLAPVKSGLERVQLKNAEVIVRSDDGEPLFTLKGADVKLPLAGTEGYITFSQIEILRTSLVTNARFSLSLEKGILVFASERFELLGEEVQLRGHYSAKDVFRVQFKSIYRDVQQSKEWGEWGLKAARLEAEMSGVLFKPKSWIGRYQVMAEHVYVNHPANQLDFDNVVSKGMLRQLQVNVPLFSCSSSELKVVALAAMNQQGDVKAKCEVLATPEEAKNIFRFTGGLQVYFPMEPILDNPDWHRSEVDIKGKLWDPQFRVHNRWYYAKTILKKGLAFLKREKEEEELIESEPKQPSE